MDMLGYVLHAMLMMLRMLCLWISYAMDAAVYCSDVIMDWVLTRCLCQWIDAMFGSRCVYWFMPGCYGIIARVT